jgi:hypothetical protein
MTPDPRRDVIVYQVAMVDALGGAALGDRWSVWLDTESQGSFETEAEAIDVARQLAIAEQRPAWLIPESGRAIRLVD